MNAAITKGTLGYYHAHPKSLSGFVHATQDGEEFSRVRQWRQHVFQRFNAVWISSRAAGVYFRSSAGADPEVIYEAIGAMQVIS